MMKKKRGQVAIFIIIAVIIIGLLIILFSAKIRTKIKDIFVPSPPNIEFENCVKGKIDEGMALISRQGGSIMPVNGYMQKDTKIEYLCYTNEYYQTCRMQIPLLKEHIERELLEYVKKNAETCLLSVKDGLKSKGYEITEGKKNIKIELVPNKIKLIADGFTIKKENAEKYDKFEANYKNDIYNLVMLSTSILNYEARYGDSDTTIYMLYYPNIKVEKYKQEDGSKIYILTNTKTKDKFTFATRSLSWPAGYGFGLTHKPN